MRNLNFSSGFKPNSLWIPSSDALRAERIRRAKLEAEAGDLARINGFKDQCKSLIGFTEYTNPKYRAQEHHRLIAYHLERVLRGEIDRIMFLVPPRHGKSELCSRRFPAWALGYRPDLHFISASASSDLAREFGYEVRNLIADEPYQAVFDVRLSEDAKAKNKWRTRGGGFYYAVGVKTDILGRGADIALIDDPFGSWDDAQSDSSRKRVWDWYQGSLYNRLEGGGRIILINHRMHDDDLVGRLLAQTVAGGDKWEVIELPAIAEESDMIGRKPGEALWPEKYPIKALRRIEKNTDPRQWEALYQQKPYAASGDFFLPDKFEYCDVADPCWAEIRAWDLAGSKEGDWTVGVRMGRTINDLYVVKDVRRLRGRPHQVREAVRDTANSDGVSIPIAFALDPGQAGVDQEFSYGGELAGFNFSFTRESGEKKVRADAYASQVNVGRVSLMRAHWNINYVSELRSFPAGKWDDQVDASSTAFNRLLQTKRPMNISREAIDRLRAQARQYG